MAWFRRLTRTWWTRSCTITQRSSTLDPNGSIEKKVKTVVVQLRTMRAALERVLPCRKPLDHPVRTWMTTCAAQLPSWFQVGLDGHTPHERLRGKPFKVRLPESGKTFRRNGDIPGVSHT